MLPESELGRMYPVVVTPSHDGRYFHNYVLSLLNLLHRADRDGLPLQMLLHRGESLITRARNNCVAQFLAQPEWTHLFWIDSDIGFSAEAFYRLLLCDHDIAAGVYPLKLESWPEEGVDGHMSRAAFEAAYTRYPVNMGAADSGSGVALHIDNDGFMELNEAPTGFMVIKRQVFERMMASYPELRYKPDSIGVSDQGYHYRFFDCMVDPDTNRYLSEDFTFCRLWNRLGGKVFVDTQSNLTHQGSKTYHGPFASSLQTNLAYAVGAPEGVKMHLHHDKPLQSNPPGPE